MTERLIRRFVLHWEDTANPTVREAYGKLAGVVGIVCNLLLCLSKLTVGALSGSIAILADGVNNLSDASSSIVTLIGFKLSGRPADKEHPYGHARMEYLAGLCVALMILVIGLELGKSSVAKIFAPTPVEFSAVTAGVLVVSIGVKFWMMLFNRTAGKRIGSPTLQAAAMDSRNDVITTAAVLAAAVFAAVTKINLDGWMGLAVALFILWSGFGIMKDTMDPLLGAAPDENLVQYIAAKILSYDGVLGTHDLIVHDYGPGRRFGSAHVEMDAAEDVMKSHNILDTIERDFCENDHIEFVLHYDPVLLGDPVVETLHARVRALLCGISPQLTMHDFRVVAGPMHTNLIFDVVAPADFSMSDAALKQRIQQLVQEGESTKYYTVVTVDKSYACAPHKGA